MADMTAGGALSALEPRLDAQARYVQGRRDYYDGKQRLAFATQKFKNAFSRFFPPMADNWMKIVVDAAVERLEVQGFRFDPDPSVRAWDVEADDEAQEIWQANNLDSGSVMAHTEAVKCGMAYAMVQANGSGTPTITIEHPSEMFVAVAKANRRIRLAALKRWVDSDGYAYANVYLPDEIAKFRSAEKAQAVGFGARIQWRRRADEPGGRNRLAQVPVVPIENNPDLLTGGQSDLDVAIPIQDAVNKLCLDMQVSSEFHAYPQRYAAGWEVPRIGGDGPDRNQVDPRAALKASQSDIWASEDPNTKFGQLEPGQVDNYIKPIELYIRHLAAQTRTPPHYLLGEIVNASGDALKAAETGLTFRCDRKKLDFSDGWEDTMRLAFLAKGDTRRGNATSAETIWADSESKNIAQLVDAAVKMRESLSLPLEMCWQHIGMSPQQIKQALSMMNLPQGGPPPSSNGTGDRSQIVLPAGTTA